MKKILLVIASQNFQPVEYGTTRDVLESSGVEVVKAKNLMSFF